MGALLKIIITLPFAAALLWVSFANRDSLEFTWSPLHDPLSVPVAVLVLGATIMGFIWGGLIVWLNEANNRRDRRLQRKDISRLEKELNQARLQVQDKPASAQILLP
jgi:uncharacterized integral membrane protein